VVCGREANDVARELRAWPADVLRRIADSPQSQLADLLPWNWRLENLRQKVA
jgi:hypothetical protein